MTTPVPPPVLVPQGFDIPAPLLELPVYEHPKWVPIPIRREDVPALQKKDESNSAQQDTREAAPAKPAPVPSAEPPSFGEVRQFTVPVINKEVPLPAPEILVTAVSTAAVASTASVGATLMAKSAFEQVMRLSKPLTKTIIKKLALLRHQEPPLSWARARRLERRPRRGSRSAIRDGS